MWNVKKNVWLINFFVTLNFAWEGVREAGDLCALKTDIEKEIKKKATVWRDKLTFPLRCHLYSKCYRHYVWELQWWRARRERCL